jgi:hypothetical protein
MSGSEDNERAALAAAREEARAAGETTAPLEPKGARFWLIAFFGFLFATVSAIRIMDPCFHLRLIWFANGEGMRECAWHAQCAINDGQFSHVPQGTGYIWFDKHAPSICQGVQF